MPTGSVAGAPAGGAGESGEMELPPGVEFVRAKRTGAERDLILDSPLIVIGLIGLGMTYLWLQSMDRLFDEGGDRAAWFASGGWFAVATLLAFAGPTYAVTQIFRDRRSRLAAATESTAEVVAIDAKGVPGEEGYRETPVVRFTTAEGRVLQARPVFEQLTPKG